MTEMEEIFESLKKMFRTYLLKNQNNLSENNLVNVVKNWISYSPIKLKRRNLKTIESNEGKELPERIKWLENKVEFLLERVICPSCEVLRFEDAERFAKLLGLIPDKEKEMIKIEIIKDLKKIAYEELGLEEEGVQYSIENVKENIDFLQGGVDEGRLDDVEGQCNEMIKHLLIIREFYRRK